MAPVNPAMENAGIEIEGPVKGPVAALAGALPIVYLEQRGLWPRTREAFRRAPAEPVARRLLTKGRLGEMVKTGATAEEVLGAVRHLLG